MTNQFHVKTYKGLENILAEELRQIGKLPPRPDLGQEPIRQVEPSQVGPSKATGPSAEPIDNQIRLAEGPALEDLVSRIHENRTYSKAIADAIEQKLDSLPETPENQNVRAIMINILTEIDGEES